MEINMLKLVSALPVAAALLSAATLSMPARAEFGKPFPITAPTEAMPFPQAAIAANGRTAFTWLGATGRVLARTRSAAGAFGPIRTLSLGIADSQPRFGVDADGDAVVSWIRQSPFGAVQVRTLSAAGVPGPLQTLTGPGENPSNLEVAVNAEGRSAFAWKASNGIRARVRSAVGALGPIRTMSTVADAPPEHPRVAVDAAGNALVTWHWIEVLYHQVDARHLSAASVLGPLKMLSPVGENSISPEVATNPSGRAVVVWMGSDEIRARAVTAANVLGPLKTLSEGGSLPQFPRIAVEDDGDAVTAWQREGRIQTRTLSRAGVLGQLLTISPAGVSATNAQVAVDADGDTVFAWEVFTGTIGRVQARFRSKGGVFGPIRTLSTAGQNASDVRIAMNADGDAVITWQQFDGTKWRAMGATTP
jgi:hypothetical protein